jgi:recombination protein RecT
MTTEISLIRHSLDKMQSEFAKVLPSHISPEKIVRSVCNALQENKRLAMCDKQSILKSAMSAAVLGLEVDNAVGQGYIVPYKGSAQFLVGYKGYITLAHNSGFMMSCEVVREKDKFNYSLGLAPNLEHIPAAGDSSSRGEITHAYAVARHATLPPVFKVLDIEQIHKRRDNSSGYKAYKSGSAKSSIWIDHYEAMCAKSAVRALAPMLPLNVQRAAALEDVHESGKHAYIDGDCIVVNNDDSNNSAKITENSLPLDKMMANAGE